MIIKAYDRETIENKNYANLKEAKLNHVLISINSKSKDAVNLHYAKSCPNCKDILPMVFGDFDYKWVKMQDDISLSGIKLFSNNDAREILGFIERNMPSNMLETLNIIVHCEYGVSRSQAVAAALSKIFTGKDDEFFMKYSPNRLVYSKILYEYYNSADNYNYINAYSNMDIVDLDALK